MRSAFSLTALVISCLTALSSIAEAKSSQGNRVLVLLDSLAEKDAYTHFWQQLQDRDYSLTFKTADDQTTSLYYFGEQLYQHIVHFAPTSSKLAQHQSLSNVHLVSYVNKGGNLLIAANSEASDNLRALVSQFDIELESDTVFDHSHYQDGDHSLITTSQYVGPNTIVDSNQVSAPVLYSGIGVSVGNIPLSSAILAAESDAFASESYSKNARTAGSVTLAGTLQSRNNARVSVVGSIDVFSDKFLGASVKGSKSGNEEFIKQLSQWTFQEKSVLKVVDHFHHKENDTEQLDWYRVKDDIVYDVDIAEYKDDKWVPYKANDVQLEIIMLDPYIRTTLKQASTSSAFGRFEARIRLPDVYGVFTFRVNYKRAGLTYLSAEDQVSIRPFRHNEYPRFLTAAYPYYASTGSMVVGFLLFSSVWLSTWGLRQTKTDTKVKAN